LVGYGSVLPVRVVDNAYLGWALGGGVIGLLLWLGGLITFTPRRARPLLVALFAIALLANPFSGPLLSAFLIACGAFTAAPVLTPATEGSPSDTTAPEGVAAAS
jgi:hypothetical protein